MPTFAAAFTIAGSPYNVLSVINGQQTTGVTKRTGIANIPAITRNWSRLEFYVDDTTAGVIYIASGPQANVANKVGAKLFSGETKLYVAERPMGQISIADKWFAVDTDGMIVQITIE